MSKELENASGLLDPQRRYVLRAASGAAIGGIAATAFAIASPALAQNAASDNRNNGPLGGRLQGVQHFGRTVQTMDRAFEFYTEVLGGTPADRFMRTPTLRICFGLLRARRKRPRGC